MNIHALYRVFFRFFRTRRMRAFLETFRVTPATRILDVGGAVYNWSIVEYEAWIALLNVTLPSGRPAAAKLPHNVSFLLGDGRSLCHPDAAFDICYSNSVIEHLSDLEQQQRFAAEVRRVGRGVWVQTPARSFFVEPHLVTPFIHYLPKHLQRRLLRNFTVWGWVTRPSAQQVDAFLSEVRLLTFREMKMLFPDCRIERERFLGFTKAYIAVREAR